MAARYDPTNEDTDYPWICRWFGHKWRFHEGFHTIGQVSEQYCARKDCPAKREVIFWVDRSVL